MDRLRWPRSALPALLLAVLVAATGCGGGDGERLPELGDGAGGAAGTAAAGSSTTAGGEGLALDSDERVLAGYAAYWDAAVAAYATNDWRSKKLAAHATGSQLSVVRNELLDNLAERRVARGEPRLFGAKVTSRDGARATVEDCIDANRWLLHDARTGKLKDTPSGKQYRLTAKLKVEDQSWKVADVTYKEERCGT
jgi:hypothetical protein